MTYYSNCCGAEIRYPNSDIDYCPRCKEWCSVELGEEDKEFFERKLAKTNNPLQKILIITIVSIVFIVLLIGVYGSRVR